MTGKATAKGVVRDDVEAITIWRKMPVGTLEVDQCNGVRFEAAALWRMAEIVEQSEMHPVHDRLEVTYNGRTVVVGVNDGAEGMT